MASNLSLPGTPPTFLDHAEYCKAATPPLRQYPAPTADSGSRLEQLTAQLRTLLTIPVAALVARDCLPQVTWPWLKAFDNAGRQLSDAAEQCLLTRGMRAILAQTVIFHWNRLGLSATTQAVLANAATAVHLP